MTAQGIGMFVGSRRVARDLSDEQNTKLRPIVQRLYDAAENQTVIAKKLGMSQSTLSGFLGKRQGTSLSVAVRACQLAGESVTDVLGLPEGVLAAASAAPPIDPPIGQFLLKLRSMPDLEKWIAEHPTKYTVSQIATAIAYYDEHKPSAAHGTSVPAHGWDSFITDAVRHGPALAVRIRGGQEGAEALERSQLAAPARRAVHAARKKR